MTKQGRDRNAIALKEEFKNQFKTVQLAKLNNSDTMIAMPKISKSPRPTDVAVKVPETANLKTPLRLTTDDNVTTQKSMVDTPLAPVHLSM